jgi:Ca2+-binding RTX toxin-like protein
LLIGGLGNDVLSGSTGHDTFNFTEMSAGQANFGKDIVVDFHAGEDIIEIGQGMFADVASVLAAMTEDCDGNAVIDAGGCNSITLAGVSVDTMIAHQANIHLV